MCGATTPDAISEKLEVPDANSGAGASSSSADQVGGGGDIGCSGGDIRLALDNRERNHGKGKNDKGKGKGKDIPHMPWSLPGQDAGC
eukprot:3416214-Heterocapsa_arctica.AAC.1